MTTMHSPHLDDGQLLMLLDGDAAMAEHETWNAHVSGCAHCTRELDSLRDDAVLVRTWIDRAAFEDAATAEQLLAEPAVVKTAPPPPRSDVDRAVVRRIASAPSVRDRAGNRWLASPWLRAAAVLLLLAAPVAAIPSLRHWISDRLPTPSAEPVDTRVLSTQVQPAPDASAIRFVPASARYSVELDNRQAAGELVIRFGSGTEATLRVDDPTGAVTITPETSLRIRNDAATRTSYTLDLPATVHELTVRVAGAQAAVLRRDAAPGDIRIPLR